jgi:Flp pilus assembly protein TadD
MQPIEIDATLKLAKRKLREGKVPEAEAMQRKVLAEQPECGEAVHFLGMAAARRGKMEEAAALVRKSIELDPETAGLLPGSGTSGIAGAVRFLTPHAGAEL